MPAPCSVCVKSSFRSSEEWSVIEYGWARWSMDTIDDIRDGEARPRSNLDLFLQSFVQNVYDFSPGCECVKISMSDSLSIEFFYYCSTLFMGVSKISKGVHLVIQGDVAVSHD